MLKELELPARVARKLCGVKAEEVEDADAAMARAKAAFLEIVVMLIQYPAPPSEYV